MSSFFNPTRAWEENQRDIGKRMNPQRIADFICARAPWARSQQFYRILRDYVGLKPGDSLLDAGCATGQLAFAAAIYGRARVTLMDISKPALDFARAVAQELRSRGKVFEAKFVRDNLEDLSIEERFDVVTNQGVLEHWFSIEERLHVLREMVKVTKPGGKVVIWVPNMHNPLYRRWIRKHVEVPERAFTIEELQDLFRSAGLINVRVFPVTAYKSFAHYTFLSKVKWVAGIFWLLEAVVPPWLLRPYLVYVGYELVAVGQKPHGE